MVTDSLINPRRSSDRSSRPGGGSLSSLFSKFTDQVSGMPSVSQIQNTIRQQVVVHDPRQLQETLKIQLAQKSLKSVTAGYEAVAGDEKLLSKNLYVWGQDEQGEDLKDMTDRLAFLVFKASEVQDAHAKRLEQSRQALKDVRNFENELVPKRAKRIELARRIDQFKQSKPNKAAPSQLTQMEADLAQLEKEDLTFEQSLSVLKRTKLHECFKLQFESQRELGEKLAILGAYGEVLMNGMESEGVAEAYTGKERSARIRAQVVKDLEEWNATFPRIPNPEVGLEGASVLGRSDTGSFGSTHATELSQIGNLSSGFGSATTAAPPVVAPVPINPNLPPIPPPPSHPSTNTNPALPQGAPSINLSPTISPVPVASPPLSPPALRDPTALGPVPTDLHSTSSTDSKDQSNVPVGPTVAETGAPVLGGGEKSGQLRRASISKDHQTIPLASLGSNDGTVLPSSPPLAPEASGSGLNRLNTVNRKRLENAEEALGGGGDEALPPAYDSEVDDADRRAEEILAREREAKRSGN